MTQPKTTILVTAAQERVDVVIPKFFSFCKAIRKQVYRLLFYR